MVHFDSHKRAGKAHIERLINPGETKLYYIAGAYRSKDGMNGVFENIHTARAMALRYWRAGKVAICPHLNSAFMDGEGTDEIFLKGDLEILRRCDVIVMLPNWKNSEGAKGELRFAKQHGLKVIYEK